MCIPVWVLIIIFLVLSILFDRYIFPKMINEHDTDLTIRCVEFVFSMLATALFIYMLFALCYVCMEIYYAISAYGALNILNKNILL